MPASAASRRPLVALALALFALTACKARKPADGEELEEREDNASTCSQGDGGSGSGPTPSYCGCYRWWVKTGTDSNVGAVNTTPVDTTIAAQRARPSPPSTQLQIQSPRTLTGSTQEVTTYRLRNVNLLGCRSESDSDVHLIIADPSDPTNATTMVAEIPSSGNANECVNDAGYGTPWKAQIGAARATFNGATTCQTSFSPPLVISLVGVGFFDDPHGQTGGSANGIELHPVVGICFGQDCTLPGGTTGGSFNVGGTVSGLAGGGLQLKNGADTITVAANQTTFTFPTKVASGSTYSASVTAQPTNPWQTCGLTGGSGTVGTSDVTTIQVACTTNSYPLSAAVSGLAGTGLVLHDGVDDLPVNASGTVQFPTALPSGTQYSITAGKPTNPSQTCSSPVTGSIAGGPATANIACTTDSFTISGKVLALTSAGLQLKLGSETINVTQNSGADVPFTFATKILSGAGYAVTIAAQPGGQTCNVSGGSGTVESGNVTTVIVNCSATSHLVGGTVSGLLGSVQLQNSSDGDLLTVSSNGGFAFATPLNDGQGYNVVVAQQPASPAQTCTVQNGSGTINGGDVSSVLVTCATSAFAIRGTVSGLAGNGLQLKNGADTLGVSAGATSFRFPTLVASGTSYDVTASAQPTAPWQTCAVTHAGGTVGQGDVTDVAVTCATRTFALTGSVSGLEGDGLTLQAGAEQLSVSGGATAFRFVNGLASGATYAVTIGRQPSGPDQTCAVQNGAGTVAGADIAMSVTCTTNAGGPSDAGTVSDAGTDAGADAGSPCPPGKHLDHGTCVVDWIDQVNGSGCASGGAGFSALAGLVALAALAARRRKSATF